MNRRLAAILAADVVGYSRLMGEDEAGTLEALQVHRENLFRPEVECRGGRIVKLMGDGTLVEFPSVVNAVEAAIAIQQSLADQNGPIRLRIGINLGDVMTDGDDIYGDGVNVAARLEALAEPGGVCVSDDTYRHAKGKVDAGFEDLGEKVLKNIADPVRVYRLLSSVDVPVDTSFQQAGSATADKPSIAVLPFKNLSGDIDQEFFADGISEDIIGALARNRWLMVIARNSTFSYKSASVDLKQVSEQLGARYVLDGSVRKGGNRVRIAARLVDASPGNQLWAERYDRVLEDIFAVQDEVTEAIVGAMAPELGKAEQQRATSKNSGNLNAWELYQRGMWHLYRRSKEDLAQSRRLFNEALLLDPGLSSACSGLVDAYYYEVVLGLADSAAVNRDLALEAARRAVEFDPDDATAHCAMGKARIVRREHALAIPNLELAIDLNPSLAWAHYGLGAAAVFSGEADRAVTHLEEAIVLSPRDQHMGSFMVRLAEAYLLKQDYDLALEWSRKALQQQGFQWSRYAVLLASLGYRQEKEQAELALSECLALRPDFSVSMVREGHLYTDEAALDHYLDGLRRAGVPQCV